MRFFLRQLPATLMIIFLSAAPALAQNSAVAEIQKGLKATNEEAGYSNLKLPDLIGNFISVILGVVGIIFLVLAVYAGVMYMTAGGDPGKVKKAKEILTQSLIGLIIIVAAYALTEFVIDRIVDASSSDKKTT